MLTLTCDTELVPNSVIKTSLIRHPDEEFGTVPFSFDSDSMLQTICDRLVYQYFEDHIIDARLFQCQRLTQCPNVMMTYRNHRNFLETQLSESSSSDNCTLPTALILRHQTKAHCSWFNSKTIVALLSRAKRACFLFLFSVLFLFLVLLLPFPLPFLFAFSSSFLSPFLSFCPCPFLFLFLFFFLFFSFCDIALPHLSPKIQLGNQLQTQLQTYILLNFHFF